jgi:hypothetical protein
MIGNMLELPKDEDTPEKRVEKIFSNMDLVFLSLNMTLNNSGNFRTLTTNLLVKNSNKVVKMTHG